MAEKLGFQQFLRDGGAVDRDELLVLAGAGIVDGPGELLFARAAFAEEKHRHIPQCSPPSQSHRNPKVVAFADDALESLDVLRALAGEQLQPSVGVSQHLRDEIHNEIERNVRDPGFALVGLIEGRRVVLALAEQQPDRRHRRRAGAEMHAQVEAVRTGDADDGGKFGIDHLEDFRVVGRVGQLDRMQHGLAAEPFQVMPVLDGAVVAQKMNFIELLLVQQAL